MFTELEIGGKTYDLRLTTKTSIALEKALGGENPINMLMEMEAGKMPTMSKVITMLHGMLQAQNHGITMDKCVDLFDKYVEEGHNMFDLIPVFLDCFKSSGYMSAEEVEDEGETEKN